MNITTGQLMRRILVILVILTAANLYIASSSEKKPIDLTRNDSLKVISPDPYMTEEDEIINTILARYHYKKFNLGDSLSSVIFDRYINSLDYNRVYFLASDIKNFEKYRFQLDDDFKDGNVKPEFLIYNVFMQRMRNRVDYVHTLLKKGFDFSKNEEYEFKRDSAAWPKDETDWNEIWREKIKSDALNLLLAGKNWPSIDTTLQKRYDNYLRAFAQLNNEDVFQIAMNALTESIDPHTDYLSPISSENFKIDMARTLEGIGAQLQSEDEYTKVNEVLPGGPAFKSNLLHNGDKIIGVAQGDKGEMVDVIGWRLNDVVQLIRGPKGTVVRLPIIPAEGGINAPSKEIKLTRDKVKLEEMSVKDDTLDITNDKTPFRFGVISIPAFYIDLDAKAKGDKNYKSTTRDVKKILDELKKEKVDGIILDLRNNGGGSLEEAITLTGLFIKNGPVVQVRSSDGSIDVEDDPDNGIAYNGPLVVLVNRFSASASEIFAAALQDYGRAIIVGENTYGKGTVQNLIDLNRVTRRSDDKYGQLKLTIAKFYRVTGGSTQHLGVKPDIAFPSAYSAAEFGESSQPSALPWDQIKAAMFTPYGNIKKYVPDLEKKHDARIKTSPLFQDLIADTKELKESLNKNYVSLNLDVRKKEKEQEEEKALERENKLRKMEGLKLLKKGEVPVDSKKPKDAELEESGYILSDYILMTVG
jgi:carboxyl-terminal processing protease